MKYQKVIQILSVFSIVLILFISSCSKDDSNDVVLAEPTIAATSPVNNATNVARNNSVEITFSEEMDPATINSTTVIVKQGTVVVPGTVTYTNKIATFTPTNSFSALTAYNVTVTTGAKTSKGRAFDANVVSSFTTGAIWVLAPQLLLILPD
jgi:Bacterial Ig-like domain